MKRTLAVIGLFVLHVGTAFAGSLHVYSCGTWSRDQGPFAGAASTGLRARALCSPGGTGLQLIHSTTTSARAGARASWQTTSPQGIVITGVWVVGARSGNIGNGKGWGGEFFWNQGSVGHTPVTDNYSNVGCCRATFHSRHVGWSISCQWPSCSNYAYLQVGEIALTATENQVPAITPLGTANLWSQRGWVRGVWPVAFRASDPSGVCVVGAALGGLAISGPTYKPNTDAWHQCPDPSWSQLVDTRAGQGSGGLGEGEMTLQLRATNAAYGAYWPQEMIHVDNQAPTVRLSGPTDAPTTAGTQYVTAIGQAGTSGVSGVQCSVDNAPPQWLPRASAGVPVSGLGVHHVVCSAGNNARDASGHVALSSPATWDLSIREPSVSTVSFDRYVGGLRCVKARRRVRIPAQWVYVRSHGRRVRVKVPAQTRVLKIVRCHPRIAVRRVYVNGRWVKKRVVLVPHARRATTRRVPFGSPTTISGWLGTARGDALPHQRVRILTAPDNGQRVFTAVASARTDAYGRWTARLPAGPSRIVTAVYGGAETVEPTFSGLARIVVPARVRLSITPHHARWAGSISISGRVLGGYNPPAGELVVLRVGWHGGSTEIGHLYTKRDGTFRSTYTFLRGIGTETYRFWAATARESDYPYAPNRSGSIPVTVSP